MHRSLRLLVAWVCLIWFGLGSCVPAWGVVVCRDSDGHTRMEWGCTRDDRGQCLSSCGGDVTAEEPEQGPSKPCEDTPVKTDQQAPRLSGLGDQLNLQAVPAALPPWCHPDRFAFRVVRTALPQGPSCPGFCCCRSVVLRL